MGIISLRKSNLKPEVSEHTMGNSLFKYIEMKMHQSIQENVNKKVIVLGDYKRNTNSISIYEKPNKLFNWKRPSAQIEKDSIIINCFPGQDYVFHYASLISTYYSLINKNIDVYYSLPSEQKCYEAIRRIREDENPYDLSRG